MRVALLLVYVHYVRYACASVDQVEEGARAGRVVERLGGLGGWPMAVAPERGGSSCCAEGVVPTVAEGVGARGEGGRRLPRRVVNLSAALRRRRGRYYFLLFPPSTSPTPSHPPSGPSVSLHALVVFVALPPFFRYHLFEVARVVLLPSSSSSFRVRLVLTRSFDATLRISIHLRIFLYSFARTASEVARSRLQRSLMRVHTLVLSLSFFLSR